MPSHHYLPPMSSNLDDVEAHLDSHGWAVYTDAGVVRRGKLDDEATTELCARFGEPSSRDGGATLWPVRPRSSDPTQTFSQRAGEAGLHTDAAYRDEPEARFALFCIRPAADGGLTRLLAAAHVELGLDPSLARRLRVPQWRWEVPEVFGGGLSGRYRVLDDDGSIRWRTDNLVIPADLQATAVAFADHLETHRMLVQLLLPVDGVLVCDNRRVLHGRTTFADRRRWLVRVRLAQR